MAGSRLALVAEQRALADSVQAHVRKHLGQPALQYAFDAIREHLAQDTDGLLVLAAGSPEDCKPACWLVQDICLQKLPPVLLLVHNDQVPADQLAHLDPYVARRLRWPDDAPVLIQLARDRTGRGHDFNSNREEALEDLLARKLLAQTPSLLPLVERVALAAT